MSYMLYIVLYQSKSDIGVGVEQKVGARCRSGRLSGRPQSRGQAFKTDNHKRSYDFKAKNFTPFCLLPCNKNTVFQHFYLPVGEGSK
jgi:hypothetical protein